MDPITVAYNEYGFQEPQEFEEAVRILQTILRQKTQFEGGISLQGTYSILQQLGSFFCQNVRGRKVLKAFILIFMIAVLYKWPYYNFNESRFESFTLPGVGSIVETGIETLNWAYDYITSTGPLGTSLTLVDILPQLNQYFAIETIDRSFVIKALIDRLDLIANEVCQSDLRYMIPILLRWTLVTWVDVVLYLQRLPGLRQQMVGYLSQIGIVTEPRPSVAAAVAEAVGQQASTSSRGRTPRRSQTSARTPGRRSASRRGPRGGLVGGATVAAGAKRQSTRTFTRNLNQFVANINRKPGQNAVLSGGAITSCKTWKGLFSAYIVLLLVAGTAFLAVQSGTTEYLGTLPYVSNYWPKIRSILEKVFKLGVDYLNYVFAATISFVQLRLKPIETLTEESKDVDTGSKVQDAIIKGMNFFNKAFKANLQGEIVKIGERQETLTYERLIQVAKGGYWVLGLFPKLVSLTCSYLEEQEKPVTKDDIVKILQDQIPVAKQAEFVREVNQTVKIAESKVVLDCKIIKERKKKT